MTPTVIQQASAKLLTDHAAGSDAPARWRATGSIEKKAAMRLDASIPVSLEMSARSQVPLSRRLKTTTTLANPARVTAISPSVRKKSELCTFVSAVQRTGAQLPAADLTA